MPWPAVAAGVASIAGAGASLASISASAYGMVRSEKAARQLWESQREVNATNIAITDKQMAFQERMSSTAHQRQIEDMRKAGLNPILSAGSGASSPGGSAVQIQSPGSPVEGVGASARDTSRMLNEAATAGYQRNMLKSTSENARANAGLTNLELSFARKDPKAYFMSKLGPASYGTGKAGSLLMDLIRGLRDSPGYKHFKKNWRERGK